MFLLIPDIAREQCYTHRLLSDERRLQRGQRALHPRRVRMPALLRASGQLYMPRV